MCDFAPDQQPARQLELADLGVYVGTYF